MKRLKVLFYKVKRILQDLLFHWPKSQTTHYINSDLDKLRRAVLLDCQPKSKETAVYVDIKWRDKILQLANAPINFDNRTTKERTLK